MFAQAALAGDGDEPSAAPAIQQSGAGHWVGVVDSSQVGAWWNKSKTFPDQQSCQAWVDQRSGAIQARMTAHDCYQAG